MKFRPRKPLVMSESETFEHMMRSFNPSPREAFTARVPSKGDALLFDGFRSPEGHLQLPREYAARNGGLMLNLNPAPQAVMGQMAVYSAWGMVVLVPVESYPEGMTHLKVVSTRARINTGRLLTYAYEKIRERYGKPGSPHPMYQRYCKSASDQDSIVPFDREAVEWHEARLRSTISEIERRHISRVPNAVKDVTSAVAVPVIGHAPTVARFTLSINCKRTEWWLNVAKEPWFKPNKDWDNWKAEYDAKQAAKAEYEAKIAALRAESNREVANHIRRQKISDLQDMKRRLRLNR